MCWEDVKIQRHSPGRQFTVLVDVTSLPVMGPNPQRTAIIIMALSAGTATIAFGAPAVTGQGIVVTTASAPFKMPASEFGSLLQQPLSVIGSAPATLTVVEVITPLAKDQATRE